MQHCFFRGKVILTTSHKSWRTFLNTAINQANQSSSNIRDFPGWLDDLCRTDRIQQASCTVQDHPNRHTHTHTHARAHAHTHFPWRCPGQHMADLEVQGQRCFTDLGDSSLTKHTVVAKPAAVDGSRSQGTSLCMLTHKHTNMMKTVGQRQPPSLHRLASMWWLEVHDIGLAKEPPRVS